MSRINTAGALALAAATLAALALTSTTADAQMGKAITMSATPQQTQVVWQTLTTLDGKCRITIPSSWSPLPTSDNILQARLPAKGGVLTIATVTNDTYDTTTKLAIFTGNNQVASKPGATFTIIKQTANAFVSKALCTAKSCIQLYIVSQVKNATTNCSASLSVTKLASLPTTPDPLSILETLAIVQ